MEKKVKKPIWKKWWVWVLAIVIVGAIGSAGNSNDKVADKDAPQENVEEVINTNKDNTTNKEETKQEEVKEEVKETKIKAGTYKIGTELPAGEYVFMSNGLGYLEVASDSTGSLDSIIANENVAGHTYITVNDGEYLKMKGGVAYAAAEAPSLIPADGIYKEGTFIVGKDIPAGEYKVTVNSTIGMGYIEVASDSRGVLQSIITNENLMEDSYITVQDGQYLKLTGAQINTN